MINRKMMIAVTLLLSIGTSSVYAEQAVDKKQNPASNHKLSIGTGSGYTEQAAHKK